MDPKEAHERLEALEGLFEVNLEVWLCEEVRSEALGK